MTHADDRPALLLASRLNFSYPGLDLFQDFSARITSGVTLVRGGDGRGKTTLLNLLGGFMPARDGVLELDGMRLDSDGEAYRRQVFFIDPRTEAYDQMMPAEVFAAMAERFPRFDHSLLPALTEGLSLTPHLEKKLFMLSTGSKRKVYLAAAFAAHARLTLLDDQLYLITQDDVIHRRVFDPKHRSFVTNFGCYIKVEDKGKMKYYSVSRQMVLFAVERRKSWRMLQSKAGQTNKDYLAQKAFLAKVDKGEIPLADAKAKTRELIAAELAAVARELRAVFEAVAAGDLDDAAERVNRLLEETQARPRLERHDGEPWHVHFHGVGDTITADWGASCATGLAVVLGGELYDRLGVCTAPHCDRVYVDTSRNGKRRFCSTACQNRVKTAAFRARAHTA